MYEQDVKLARMLIEKIKAIKGEESTVKTGLEEARNELNRVQQIREERDTYLSILSEAADLLDSKDLVIENPDTTEQQETVDGLEFKLEELDEEAQKYNRLIDALREKAPQLFEAVNEDDPEAAPELSEEALEAAGEEARASLEETTEEAEVLEIRDAEAADEDDASDSDDNEEDAETEEGPVEIMAEEEVQDQGEEAESADDDDEDDAEAQEDEGPATLEVHVGDAESSGDSEPGANGNGAHEAVAEADSDEEQATAAADTQPAPGPAEETAATVVKVAVESPERTLSRFNLDHLKKKEAFTFGRGAAYIVDGDSVLDRLPYYDFSLRGVLEAQTRDELARDIDVLSTELHGKFHIVFSSEYSPSIKLGEHVTLDCASGSGGKDAGDEHVRNLVSELIAKHTCVCVITGDVALADSVRGQSIHILQLHDFFRA